MGNAQWKQQKVSSKGKHTPSQRSVAAAGGWDAPACGNALPAGDLVVRGMARWAQGLMEAREILGDSSTASGRTRCRTKDNSRKQRHTSRARPRAPRHLPGHSDGNATSDVRHLHLPFTLSPCARRLFGVAGERVLSDPPTPPPDYLWSKVHGSGIPLGSPT